MSFFKLIQQYPIDPILGLQALYNQDSRPDKVNLGIGTYQDAQGKPLVFKAVRKAEEKLFQQALNKNYLPIEGYAPLVKGALELMFADKAQQKNIFGMQTVGGTAAIRIALEFLVQRSLRNIYLSQPTWINHHFVCDHLKLNVQSYPYFNAKTQKLDFAALTSMIEKMPPGSSMLIHASCHNPTGIDPTHEEWKELSSLLKKHQIFPFFDFAYQGLGQSLEQDAWPIRYFLEQGHEMVVTYSFSKNLGLYGERVGVLVIVTEDQTTTQKVVSQIKHQTRMIYSTPALSGGRLAGTVLEDAELKADWQKELETVRARIVEMRCHFGKGLQQLLGESDDLKKIEGQKGMFSVLNLTSEAIGILREKYGVYTLDNGRINLSGLNHQNLDYALQALVSVMK